MVAFALRTSPCELSAAKLCEECVPNEVALAGTSPSRSITVGATKPRTSSGYTATFALLHASIVAVNSDMRSGFNSNPAVKRIKLFLPGMLARFFARLRIESNRV